MAASPLKWEGYGETMITEAKTKIFISPWQGRGL